MNAFFGEIHSKVVSVHDIYYYSNVFCIGFFFLSESIQLFYLDDDWSQNRNQRQRERAARKSRTHETPYSPYFQLNIFQDVSEQNWLFNLSFWNWFTWKKCQSKLYSHHIIHVWFEWSLSWVFSIIWCQSMENKFGSRQNPDCFLTLRKGDRIDMFVIVRFENCSDFDHRKSTIWYFSNHLTLAVRITVEQNM